ncbi:MAG: prepilin-type N-terminal cleavage/methylation domain-containing protein [Acidobacteriia bacterium]|nr:prepilin-type N-terminal cleavage/methylation domain-containing protein [Terriglobia bacterium]
MTEIIKPFPPSPGDGQRGFTLIELSVVLIIIGFIAGGIVAGQALIRGSQVQSVVVDAQTYIRATQMFQQKYNSLPGDMYNATSYWGTASGGCPNGPRTGTQTCNGNGDGIIVNLPGDAGSGNWNDMIEAFLVWQHLADAGFVQGSYTGIPGSGGIWDMEPGSSPASRVPGGWFAVYYLGVPSDSNNFPLSFGHVLVFGAVHPGSVPANGIINPNEALSIDNKQDDGLPASGMIVSQTKDSTYAGNCTTSDSAATAQYAVTVTGNNCSLYFKTGF